MELYYVISITDRAKAKAMERLYLDAGAGLVVTKLGKGTATQRHLLSLGLDATEKAVLSAAASQEAMKKLFHTAKEKLYIDIPGNGILMAVPLKSVCGGQTLRYLTHNQNPMGGVPNMNFSHELIVVILNEGYSDMVMDAARAAGATGGTVLHAKGTGTASPEKFFGVSLALEKDVIYILAGAKEKAQIMQAIQDKAGPATKAGAISFSLPVSQTAGLRRLDEE